MARARGSLLRLLRILATGAAGGVLVTFISLLFCDVIGHSGSTGSEGVSDWDPGHAWMIALPAGTMIGMFLFPIGHFFFLRRVPLKAAAQMSAWGTLGGGLLGCAISGPGPAMVLATIGFFVACAVASRRYREHRA